MLRHLNTSKWLFLAILWMIYWLAVAGATVYVLPVYLDADQFHNSWITTLYFALFAIVSGLFFKIKESMPHLHRITWQIRMIVYLAAAFIILTFAFDLFFTLNHKAQAAIFDSQLYYPLFSIQTTIPKTVDIIFQQITIFGFIKYLIKENYDKHQIRRIVWLAFACVHLPLILKPGIYWITLVLPSLFAGWLFANFILNFRYGLIYSYALHFFFYIGTGVFLRVYHSL